jgi:hypothetical protein
MEGNEHNNPVPKSAETESTLEVQSTHERHNLRNDK